MGRRCPTLPAGWSDGVTRNTWSVQVAKASLSELLEQSISDGPQLVTRCGEAAAVLLSMVEWNALQARVQRTLKDVLLNPAGPKMDDLQVPERGPHGPHGGDWRGSIFLREA